MGSTEREPIHEEAVTLESSAGPLEGTLAVPGLPGSRGSVLILPGSGPLDRDGNTSLLRMNISRDLARALGVQGFVTLRYDKRGTGRSRRERFTTGFWDLVDDAETAVELLRRRFSRNPVILLGHSEGCIVAPAVNARRSVEGLILLAGPCESLAVTVTRQRKRAAEDFGRLAGIKGALLRALRVVERQRRRSDAVIARILASDRPWIRVSVFKVNAKWLREHFAYDVALDLPGVRCPMLAISGAKDVQVLPEHARLIAETVAGPAEWRVLPNMTHVLRRTTGPAGMAGLLRLYRLQSGEPLDAELLGIVSTWLDARFPARRSLT